MHAFTILSFKTRVPSKVWCGVQPRKQVNWHQEGDGNLQRPGSCDCTGLKLRGRTAHSLFTCGKSNLGLRIYSVILWCVLPDLCATRSLLMLIRFGSARALGCAAGSQAQHMVCCCYQPGASCGSGMIPDPARSEGWCRQMTPDLASSAGTATPWTFLTNLRWQSEFLLAVSWLQCSWCISKHLKAVLSSSQNHAFKHPLSNICMCRGGV